MEMDTGNGEGVIGRKLTLCPWLSSFPTEELIRTCDDCDCFLVYCCGCNSKYDNDGRFPSGRMCHHYRLIFTDGACLRNGQADATAGIGIAGGATEPYQLSVAIDDELDPGQKRTSQRAELLAALTGLGYLIMEHENSQGDEKKDATKKKKRRGSQEEKSSWIIATDSEYVVKGMTEWLPTWKANNYRTNRNTTPANLDLFMRLDKKLSNQERKKNVKIGFFHVLRQFNTIADRLAKKAALDGDLASAATPSAEIRIL